MSAIVHNSWEEVSSVDVDTGQWKVSVSRHRWSTVHQIPPWWEKTPNATLSHSTLPQGGGRCAMADGNATFYSCLIKSHFLTYWMNVSVKSKMMKKKHQRKKKHKRKQIKNKKARIRFFFCFAKALRVVTRYGNVTLESNTETHKQKDGIFFFILEGITFHLFEFARQQPFFRLCKGDQALPCMNVRHRFHRLRSRVWFSVFLHILVCTDSLSVCLTIRLIV